MNGQELIGPLGLPGAVAALLAAVWFGVGLWDKLTRKREPNGTGDWRANATAAMAALTSATAHLTQAVRDIGENMSDMKARSATVDVRLASLVTREDLNLAAEKNRHDNRNELTKVLGALADIEDLLQRHDAWERGRVAAQGGSA